MGKGKRCIGHADPTVQPHVRLTQQVLLIKFDYTLLLIIRCLFNFLTSLIKLCLWWVSATQLQTSSTKSSRIKDQCYFLLNHLKVKPCNKYHIRMFLRTIDKWVLIHICTYHTDLELGELHVNLMSYLFC